MNELLADQTLQKLRISFPDAENIRPQSQLMLPIGMGGGEEVLFELAALDDAG